MFQKIIDFFYSWFERFLRRHSKYLMMAPYNEGPYNRDYDDDATLSN